MSRGAIAGAGWIVLHRKHACSPWVLQPRVLNRFEATTIAGQLEAGGMFRVKVKELEF